MVQVDHMRQQLGHHRLKGLSSLGLNEVRQAAGTGCGWSSGTILPGINPQIVAADAPVNDGTLLCTVAALQQQECAVSIREALCNLHAHMMLQDPCWRLCNFMD